jgi:hypothetical protein
MGSMRRGGRTAHSRCREKSCVGRVRPSGRQSQVTTVGYSAFSLAVAGVVRGDAERLQVRMRQTPPVARCASHPPKRAERRCGAGGRCRCYWRAGAPEGPARARSRGAAPTARQVAGAGIARRGEPGGLRRSGYSSPQVDGFAGAALGGIAAEQTVEGAPPGDQRPAKPSRSDRGVRTERICPSSGAAWPAFGSSPGVALPATSGDSRRCCRPPRSRNSGVSWCGRCLGRGSGM